MLLDGENVSFYSHSLRILATWGENGSRTARDMQAMFKLQEPSQVIQCREEDLSVLKTAIPKAEAKYKSQYGEAAPQVTIDQKHFLAKSAKTQEEEDDPDAATWYVLHYCHGT